MTHVVFFPKTALFLVFSGIILGVNGQAFAFQNTDFVIGLRTGWTNPEIGDHGTLSNAPVLGITGGIRKGALEWELGADGFKTTHKIDVLSGFGIIPILAVGQVETLETDFSMLRLMVSGKFHFQGWNRALDFYLGAGGGGYITREGEQRGPRSSVSLVEGVSPGTNVEFELENVYGAQFLTGLDYRFSPGIQAGLEYRILILKSELFLKSSSLNVTFPTRIIQQEFSFSIKHRFP